MRKIIFRGKKDYNNEWVYGNLIQFDWADFIVKYGSFEERQRVIPETVSQFTGLTDKNGKDIYEGDIVKQRITESVSVFKYELGGFDVDISDNMDWNPSMNGVSGLTAEYYNIEIIGNIHDNPELLTSK